MNEYSAPPAGHKADYHVYWVYCKCGWSFPTSWNWRQVNAYSRHMQQVDIDSKEKKLLITKMSG